jgi:hypothetical protein
MLGVGDLEGTPAAPIADGDVERRHPVGELVELEVADQMVVVRRERLDRHHLCPAHGGEEQRVVADIRAEVDDHAIGGDPALDVGQHRLLVEGVLGGACPLHPVLWVANLEGDLVLAEAEVSDLHRGNLRSASSDDGKVQEHPLGRGVSRTF